MREYLDDRRLITGSTLRADTINAATNQESRSITYTLSSEDRLLATWLSIEHGTLVGILLITLFGFLAVIL